MAGDDDREAWTVGEFLDAVRDRDPSAHGRFLRCAQRLAVAKAKRTHVGREDAEDAAMESYCVAMTEDCAALTRVKHRSTRLSSWIAGVLSHLLAGCARRDAQARAGGPPSPEDRLGVRRAELAEARRARLGDEAGNRLRELTPKQRHALDLHLEGLSTAVIARRLGIGRDATLERIWRACAHLLSTSRVPAHHHFSELLGPRGPKLSPDERATLAALARGATYRQAATSRGESPVALRSRVQRIRRRARRGY